MILPLLSALFLAAHFSRVQMDWLALPVLLFPLILLIKRRWVLRLYQAFLVLTGVVWIQRLFHLQQMRSSAGEPWVRLALILGFVAALAFLSALIMNSEYVRRRYPKGGLSGSS